MKIVDTKGQLCPAPLIATKKALKEVQNGETFIVLTDNQTSFDNLSRFLKDNKAGFSVNTSAGVWTLTIKKGKAETNDIKVEDYCSNSISHFEKGNFIVVVSSDKMGEGDDYLGHLLISNFIKALKDLEKLPGHIVFYNKGVTLATSDSLVIEHLNDLERMGVVILLCATCVSYYKLEAKVGAGTLSNMYSIAEVMAAAGNIIKP